MDLFSDALTRLKYLLRVSKDGEVAAALGMSKTAFAERKRRRAFPEKELRALAQASPELGIDVDYVLTGEPYPPEDETQEEFAARIQSINQVRALIDALPIDDLSRMRLAAVMTGTPSHDGPLIAEAIRVSLNQEVGDHPPAPPPPTREDFTRGTGLDPAWPMVLELVYDQLVAHNRRLPNGKALRELVDAVVVVLRLEEGEPSNEKIRRKIEAIL